MSMVRGPELLADQLDDLPGERVVILETNRETGFYRYIGHIAGTRNGHAAAMREFRSIENHHYSIALYVMKREGFILNNTLWTINNRKVWVYAFVPDVGPVV